MAQPQKISNGVKVLMISRDPNAMDRESEVAKRMVKYGEPIEQLEIVVFPAAGQVQLSPKVKINGTSFLSVFRLAMKVARILQPTLVTTPDPFLAGLVGVFLKRSLGCKLEIQVHTDFLSPYFNGFKNLLYQHLALWVLKRADCVRAVSKRIENSLKIENSKLKINILPIYTLLPKITGENITQKYGQFNFIILMVSRLTKEKNIGMAIDAMQKLIAEFPKALLLIVGNGPEEKNLRLKAYNLKLGQNVLFAGWKENLGDYYKAADLYLLTSDFEGWGRTVIEAASMGVPVVMTNVGLAGEVIEHEKSGFIFEPRDKDGLVKILKKIIRNEANAGALAEEARKKILPNFNEGDYIRILSETWKQCAS